MEKQKAERIANHYQSLVNKEVKQIHTPYFVLIENVFALKLANPIGNSFEDYQVFYSGIHQFDKMPIIDSLSSLIGLLAE